MSNSKEEDTEFLELIITKYNRIRYLNYIMLFISLLFTVTGLVAYVQFKLQYGEIHNILIGEWVNDVIVYTYQPDYAYVRLIVALLFSIFLYGIAESNNILNLVYVTVKEVLEENKE